MTEFAEDRYNSLHSYSQSAKDRFEASSHSIPAEQVADFVEYGMANLEAARAAADLHRVRGDIEEAEMQDEYIAYLQDDLQMQLDSLAIRAKAISL